MHTLEKAFIDLLRGNLSIPDNKIFTGNRYKPSDISPCVNVMIADEMLSKQKYVEIDNIQHIQKRYSADLWINIWSNTEEERQKLIEEINDRLIQAEANHYSTCTNYIIQNNACNISKKTCDALTLHNGRTNKKQCPKLDIYESFFKKKNIVKRTFTINSITNLDELDSSETILRTIFKINMDYYILYPLGGKIFNSVKISEELI